MVDDPTFSENLINIATGAGAAIMEVYRAGTSVVHTKDDRSPLTAADLAAHTYICDALHLEFPSTPILSEESAMIPWLERQHWHTFFLVDPLDGTKEFIKRNDEFTVNIALIQGGKPIAGVVHAPALAKTWYTKDGQAYRADETGHHAIQSGSVTEGAMHIVASRSHADETLERFLGHCPAHNRISMGSSLKLCAVAEGTATLYPRLAPTMEWDTAAAHAIGDAAGATVTDTAGNPLAYNKPNLLNPHFIVAAPNAFDWQAALSLSGYDADVD